MTISVTSSWQLVLGVHLIDINWAVLALVNLLIFLVHSWLQIIVISVNSALSPSWFLDYLPSFSQIALTWWLSVHQDTLGYHRLKALVIFMWISSDSDSTKRLVGTTFLGYYFTRCHFSIQIQVLLLGINNYRGILVMNTATVLNNRWWYHLLLNTVVRIIWLVDNALDTTRYDVAAWLLLLNGGEQALLTWWLDICLAIFRHFSLLKLGQMALIYFFDSNRLIFVIVQVCINDRFLFVEIINSLTCSVIIEVRWHGFWLLGKYLQHVLMNNRLVNFAFFVFRIIHNFLVIWLWT